MGLDAQAVNEKTFTPVNDTSYFTNAIKFQQASSYINPSDTNLAAYYQQVQPLADAVDKIGTKLAEITPYLRDTNGEFVRQHQLLQLLKYPNTLQSYFDFMMAASNFLHITGNCYFILTRSNFRLKLFEMYVPPPQTITSTLDTEGYVSIYYYTPQGTIQTFTRKIENGNFRYYSDDGNKELIHLRDFNPNYYSYKSAGTSRVNSILLEVLQLRAGSEHNLSLLQNGMTPSGLCKLREEVDADQANKFEAELENMYSGAGNAGRVLASNMIEDYLNFMENNRDMDYINLRKEAAEAIYRRFNIPLVLVNTDAATYDNYNTALSAFYDDAILPTYKRISSFLMKYFQFYYPDLINYELSYDELTIPALRARKLAELEAQDKLGVLTDNEKRQTMGLEKYNEGDEIWKSTALAPVSTTLESSDQPDESITDEEPDVVGEGDGSDGDD